MEHDEQPSPRAAPPWARVLAAALIAAVVLAQTAAWWLPGELMVHWTLHAAIALVVPMIWLRRHRGWREATAIAFVVALWPWLASAYEPRAPRPAGHAITVACANLLYTTEERGANIDAIAATGADLIALCEVVPADRERLEHDPRWPYQRWYIGRPCGNALLSRVPLLSVADHLWHEKPAIEAVIEIDGAPLRIVAVHPWSPTSPRKLRERDGYLATLAGVVRASREPVLVLGDCNITTASPVWRAFRSASGLLRPRDEPRTWPSPLAPVGIGIDHILVGAGLALGDERPVFLPRSDHRGLVARLSWLR